MKVYNFTSGLISCAVGLSGVACEDEQGAALAAIDTISDFNTGDSDKIDVSDVLQGYDTITHAITDFIKITTNGSNSILKVDVDGTGNNFVQITKITEARVLTDEAALVTSGNLIVI